MSPYLKEAAFLASETPNNRCPSTDARVILDSDQSLRLVGFPRFCGRLC